MRRRPLRLAVPLAALVIGAGACSDDEPSSGSTTTDEPTTTVAESTTTAVAPPPTATLTEEAAVAAAYRQGVARADGGWLFSTNQALYLTDEALERTVENTAAIPPDLMTQGYDHIGDADIVGGVLYAPLEQGDYDRHQQLMLEYDAATLEFVDSAVVEQAHNAWVSVDDGVAYSMSDFDGDDVVLRYDVESWEPLEPITLTEAVARVQGGDVLDGYLWLSTDDEGDGIYRVALESGQVDRVGALSRPDGEGEGIDATDLPTGQLHAVSVDVALAPIWFQHFALEPR